MCKVLGIWHVKCAEHMVYKPGGFVLGVWHVSLKERCRTCGV